MRYTGRRSLAAVGTLLMIAGTVVGVTGPAAASGIGWIDPTYGDHGSVAVPADVYLSTMDHQGRVLVGNIDADETHVDLTRYTADGAVDTTFGVSGSITLAHGGESIHADADGTTTVLSEGAGDGRNNDNYGATLTRFTSSGAVDTGFGTDGVLFVLPSATAEFTGFAERSDGDFMLAFNDFNADSVKGCIVAVGPSGALDPTWAPTAAVHGVLPINVDFYGAAIVADGTSVLVENEDAATLTRYTATGALDSTFGSGGALSLSTALSDSPITASGGSYYLSTADYAHATGSIVKLTSTGKTDTTFGNSGTATFTLPSPGQFTYAPVISGASIYVIAPTAGVAPFEIERMSTSGIADSSFGSNGLLQIDQANGTSAMDPEWLAIQPSGRTVIEFDGSTDPSAGLADTSVLMRLLASPTPGVFAPNPPTRILDTRNGTGAAKHAVAGGGSITLSVAGHGGVPAVGVAAVVLNLTVTQPAGGGYLTVYPAGGTLPTASNINFAKNQTIANQVTVKLGTNGQVVIRNGSASTVQIIADVEGYFFAGATTEPGTFTALSPARILDTRSGIGAPTGAVSAGGDVTLTVAGQGGVPSNGAASAVLNLTVTGASSGGYLTAYPAGGTLPTASNINFAANQTVANLTTIKLGTDGQIVIHNGGTGSVNIIADVAGYYLSGTPDEAGTFVPLTPARILDTRSGTGAPKKAVAAHGSITLTVSGFGGVPASGVAAVVLNLTVTQAGANGYLIAYPAAATQPTASNINFATGQTIANLVTVRLDGGKIIIYNGGAGTVQIIADVAGYYLS